jgi:hypothetical protein
MNRILKILTLTLVLLTSIITVNAAPNNLHNYVYIGKTEEMKLYIDTNSIYWNTKAQNVVFNCWIRMELNDKGKQYFGSQYDSSFYDLNILDTKIKVNHPEIFYSNIIGRNNFNGVILFTDNYGFRENIVRNDVTQDFFNLIKDYFLYQIKQNNVTMTKDGKMLIKQDDQKINVGAVNI